MPGGPGRRRYPAGYDAGAPGHAGGHAGAGHAGHAWAGHAWAGESTGRMQAFSDARVVINAGEA
jgi:hypothetical protein